MNNKLCRTFFFFFFSHSASLSADSGGGLKALGGIGERAPGAPIVPLAMLIPSSNTERRRYKSDLLLSAWMLKGRKRCVCVLERFG